MKSVFLWLAFVNLAGALVVVLTGILPMARGVPDSVEMTLVPIGVPARAVPAAVPAERAEIPERFRPADPAPKPWDELPGGAVRLRP